MSGQAGEILTFVFMGLGLLSMIGSLVLHTRRRLPEGGLVRNTLLIVGLSLVQVGGLANDQEERSDIVRLSLLALLLVVLAVAAFREGWRAEPKGPSSESKA
jgi:hypothetical protein